MKTALRTTSALCAFAAIATGGAHAEIIHSVTQIKYDNNNRAICTAVRMNPAIYGSLPSDACALGTESATYGPDRITRTWYNNAGEVTHVDEAYGTGVQRAYARYTYSSNGQKTTEKDANGNLTTLEYDGVDRLKKVRYPSTTVGAGTSSTTDYEQFGYDDNNNKTYWRRRDGQELNDCFDNLNRGTVHYVHSQSGCTATGGVKDVYTTYDGLGRITSKRFSSFGGTGVTYAYDGLGRVSSTTDINGRTLGYQYNIASARTRLTFPDGNYIGNDLDNAGRVKTFGWNATSGIFGYGYNSLGQIVSEARGGGSVSYGYDAIGRLTSKTNDFISTASDITWGFSFNPSSQIATTTTSSNLYDYEELTSIIEPAQSHDGLNRISTLVGATGACPSGGYDGRANLICDGTGRSYTYDVENRLLTGNIAGNSLILTYDPEGRLASYSWNGGSVSFLYDGINLIGEYNSSNQLLRRYVHGPGTDNPVAWYEGSSNGTLRYFYTNQQGSVITTADSAGNRGDIYAYGAYGEPKDQYGFNYWPGIGTGPTSVSRFGYTGQTFLAGARLYYYKARVYDPAMGRFLQTDPIGSADDLNLYAYVKGDPVNSHDPTGLTCDPVGDGSYQCKVDNVEKGAEDIAGDIKDAYSDVVNGLAALESDTVVTVQYEDKSYNVTAGVLVAALAGATVTAKNTTAYRAVTQGPAEGSTELGYGAGPMSITRQAATRGRNGFSKAEAAQRPSVIKDNVEADLRATIIHEAFHLFEADVVLQRQPNYLNTHKDWYNPVSEALWSKAK